MSNVDLFQVIAKELSAGRIDDALWTRAIAQSGGDDNKTKAEYIKLRLAVLEQQLANANAGASPTAGTGPAAARPALDLLAPEESSATPVDDRMQPLRTELRQLLALQGKRSLYATIGCHADASTAAIRQTCANLLEQQRKALGSIPPELQYAAQTLSDAEARAAYDEKLLSQLKAATAPRPANLSRAADERSYDDNASPGRMRQISMVIVGVLILAGGLLASRTWLGFGEQKVAERAVDTVREAVQYAGENDAGRVANERILAEGHVDNQSRAIEVTSELGNRSLDIADRQEDRQWRESDARINAMEAQAEERRASQEERRRQAELAREDQQQARDAQADEGRREQLRVSAMNQSLAENDFYTARQLARSSSEHSRVDYAEQRYQAAQER